MSIYAEKRSGKPTGRWVAEVMRGGVKTRLRFQTYEEARLVEDQLMAGLPVRSIKEAALHTLGWLHGQSADIWEGCKDDQQAKRFGVCVGLIGADTLIRDVRTEHLDDLKKQLGALRPKRKCHRTIENPNTIHRYLSSVSAALRWAHKRGIISGMPSIPWPKVVEPTKRFFQPDEEAVVLKYLTDHGREDEALCVRVLSQTGMRIGELLKLKPDFIANGYVLVGDWVGGTKTGDNRYAPIEDDMARALVALIERGMPSYRMILKSLKAACAATGVDVRKTPHKLRHTTATRLVKAGVQIAVIKDFMGHRNIKTTMGYISVEAGQLKAAQGLLRGVEECGRNLEEIGASVCKSPEKQVVENVGNFGGLARNRTGVQGFAVAKPLITQRLRSTLRGHSVTEASPEEPPEETMGHPNSPADGISGLANGIHHGIPDGTNGTNGTNVEAEDDNPWVTLVGDV